MRGTVQAGKLRHRVQVQAPSRAQDAYGQAVVSFASAGLRWASIEPLSGRELFQAAAVRSDVTHRITLRYFAGLSPAHRLQRLVNGVATEVYQILDVLDEDVVNRKQVCTAKEVV